MSEITGGRRVITGATIRTAGSGPRVELDDEGSWYCDDDGTRIPYAEYVATRPPLRLDRPWWEWLLGPN